MKRASIFCAACIVFFALSIIQVKPKVAQPKEEWSRAYGGAGRELAESVVQTSDGGYALAGGMGLMRMRAWGGELDFWLVKLSGEAAAVVPTKKGVPWAFIGGVIVAIAVIGALTYFRKR